MNRQIQLNEFGLAELLAADLNQIAALASAARYLLTNGDCSVYIREAAELMAVIQNLAGDAEQLRAEWQAHIPRYVCQRSGGVR
ncbi:hypothetical protein ETB55_21740 [Salmonella enterica subsp. enterica serovar Omuna]|nr:hypothetical protein [Salmonella enterica subsp. enterica serovar Omuna]